MSPTFLLLLGACVMVGVIAAAYLAMLVFHDPNKPRWLEAGWADDAVTVLLIAVGTIDFGLVLRNLAASGVDPLVAMTMELAFFLGVAALLWRKLHMSERLDAARNGLSPFMELRHIRHRRRGGMSGGGAVGMA